MGFRRRLPLTGSLLSSTLARWTQPGFIKNVQRNTVTIAAGATSGTATITAVILANSKLKNLSYVSTNAAADARTDYSTIATRVELTNSTTVTAFRTTSDVTYGQVVSFEVIEYFPGVIKSVQRGTIDVVAGTGGTATITTVNVAKCETEYLGCIQSYAGAFSANTSMYSVVLTNATTVTLSTSNSASNPLHVGYQVTEFF